jgi:general secretion pathway protein A
MYEEYFGLTKKPFSIVPDPRYFYTSEGHREALAHLLYGIESDGGFVLLTGEVGTGKTTVCRRLLEVLPEKTEVAFILNPKVTVEELLATVCDEFRIRYPEGASSIKVFVACINDYLLDVHAKGRRAVLIIEEAQNLEPEVLEQIRLLTNLETKDHKLLQIIMIGQPELRDMLAKRELLQLSQRITARYHLGALPKEEISAYVNYRLSVAGLVRGQLFPPPAMKALFRLTGGVPRLINVICDRALLGAYVQGKEQVDVKTLTTAAREVSGEEGHHWSRHRVYQGILAGLVLVLFGVIAVTYRLNTQGSNRLWGKGSGTIGQNFAADARTGEVGGATLRRPPNHTAAAMKEMAYGALFSEWHIPYDQGGGRPVCEQARDKNLRCLKGKGSVTHLRQMNKPAVLSLSDEKGAEFYAVLIALRGETATFAIGSETRTVRARDIVQWWSGDYLLLWRAPPEYKDELRPGNRGGLVAWLDKQLALAQGQPVPAAREQMYSEDLVKAVKKFQLAAGMVPDGIVGPRTLMRLSGAAGKGEPVLHDGKGSE